MSSFHPILATVQTTAMSNRLTLTIRWVREHCEFLKVSASEQVIARVQMSVNQLTDAEVEQFLSQQV